MPEKQLKTRYFHAHETARFDALNGLPLAGFRRRAFAIGIDGALILILRMIFGFRLHHEENEAFAGTLGWFLLKGGETIEKLLESTLYFAVALKLGKGQTPGKWLMKIKVLSLTHHELGWWQSIERGLGYGASLLEGGFGFLQFYINRNRMCVHDRIAETIVVDVQQQRKPQVLEQMVEAGEHVEAITGS